MRGWPIAVLCAGAALALSGAASAHGEDAAARAAQARANLDAGLTTHASVGYARDQNVPDIAEALPEDIAFIWPIYLRAGVNYRIYGACDEKCSDLDMEVYGSDGRIVDRDTRSDATPFVQITPAHTATHYVRFWIPSCDDAPCNASFRVVSGGTPGPHGPAHVARRQNGGDGEEVVEGELDDAGGTQLSAGYNQFGEDQVDAVSMQSQGHRATLHLHGGSAYVFIGACDQNCDDVDMEIMDSRGRQIASDIASDDRPIVAIAPPRDGDYAVRIWLASCARELCTVGFRSFRRDPPVARAFPAPPAPDPHHSGGQGQFAPTIAEN